MQGNKEWQSKTDPEVTPAHPGTQIFASGIVKRVAGADEKGENGEERASGAPIASRPPGKRNVEDQQRAQQDEREHGGSAVQSLHPQLCWMRAFAKFADVPGEMMQPRPRRSADENQPNDCVNRPLVAAAKSEAVGSSCRC